jgi:integrase
VKKSQKTVKDLKSQRMPKITENQWTEPKIYPKNPQPSDMKKSWRVEFRFFDSRTGKWHPKPFAYKHGINYIKNYRERIAEVNAMKTAILIKLNQGWNPITNTTRVKSPAEIEIENLQQMNFSEAMDFAFKKKTKDWSKRTRQSYEGVIKYLKEAVISAGLYDLKISEMKRRHFKLLLEEVTEKRKLSAKGYNKYREYLSSLVGELIQWDAMEYNLIRDIKTKEVLKTVAHRPPTKDQRLAIVSHIKSQHPDYYRYLAVLYGCTIRPKEITGLKIKHLHKIEQVFRLIPDRIEETTKTNFEREIPIPNWLMDLLSQLNLHKYDPDWYIFSTRNKYSSFLPGPNRMHTNTTNLWWRTIVKEGLKIDVNQYSLKKLSGDDMVRLQRREHADNLLELPRMMMGHTKQGQTEDYVTEHREVLKDLIRNKMPEL